MKTVSILEECVQRFERLDKSGDKDSSGFACWSTAHSMSDDARRALDQVRKLTTALSCLYRLAARSGLCPPGEKRCEMDMAHEALESEGLL